VKATRSIRAHLDADYGNTEDGLRLFAENVVSAIKLSPYPSGERIREVEELAADESMPPSERRAELVKLLRQRLDEDSYLRPG
jgi:hypothetical protein